MLYFYQTSKFKIYNMTNGKSGGGGANIVATCTNWIRESGVSHEVKRETEKKFKM